MLNHHICHSICLFLVAMGPIAKGDSDLNIGIYEKAFTAADPGDIMIVINNLLDQVELVGKKAKATRYRSREAFLTALKSGDVDIAPLVRHVVPRALLAPSVPLPCCSTHLCCGPFHPSRCRRSQSRRIGAFQQAES